jgi:hypothetical protein
VDIAPDENCIGEGTKHNRGVFTSRLTPVTDYNGNNGQCIVVVLSFSHLIDAGKESLAGSVFLVAGF